MDWADSQKVLLEIGTGDGALALSLAHAFGSVIGVDVVNGLWPKSHVPRNVDFRLTDGFALPVSTESVDVVYTYQVLEHFHPEDVAQHLSEVYRVLRRGGCYICVTPSRLSGPHDVSKFFGDVARGLHLREYSVGDLVDVFGEAGLSVERAYIGGKGLFIPLQVGFALRLERFLASVPASLGKHIRRSVAGRSVLGVRVVGRRLT